VPLFSYPTINSSQDPQTMGGLESLRNPHHSQASLQIFSIKDEE